MVFSTTTIERIFPFISGWALAEKIQFGILIIVLLSWFYTMISDMVKAFLRRKKIVLNHFCITKNGTVASIGSDVGIELVNSNDYTIGIVEVACKLRDKTIHSNKHPYSTQIHNIEARDNQPYSVPLQNNREIKKEDILYVFTKEVGGKRFKFYPNGKWKTILCWPLY